MWFGGAAAHVAERLERVLSLGYITVVPQVVQVPTEPVQQPDVGAGTMGNGMYAAHDEPVSFRQATSIPLPFTLCLSFCTAKPECA